MRQEFAKYLYNLMDSNQKVWLLTGDLGFGLFDNIRNEFPDRFLNTGAAEQSLIDIAIGLSLEGQIPIVYSITPFLLYRPFESIRTYINHEKIPVILIGSGRNRDYEHDGFSHYAGDDKKIMATLPNIICKWPENTEDMKAWLNVAIGDKSSWYINLRR